MGTIYTHVVESTRRIIDDSWMQTFTGKVFNIFAPTPETVCIEDIAHALSMRCRFNGHCKRFYSVAEHSVLMARACKIAEHSDIMRQVTTFDKRGCLMHDITEAYLPDVVRPIKSHLMIWTPWGVESFREFEHRLLGQLLDCLDLTALVFASGETAKWMDGRMLATEAACRDLMTDPEKRWGSLPPVLEDVELGFWPPFEGELSFLYEFKKLFGEGAKS